MHPILFKFGPLTLYSYGLFVALAFLLSIVTAAERGRRYGWRPETIYDTCVYALLAALLGSRLLYVITNPAEFASSPLEIVMVWRGGLVYYGGVIAAVIVGAWYLRRQHRNVLEGFDLIVPSLALGHAIGRVGCFLNGCCFGRVCSLPWAVTFPAGSPAHAYQVYETRLLAPESLHSAAVHPTQIYETLIELCVFCVLSLWLPRKKFNGQIFLLYLVFYGAGRFIVEFLRADNPVVLRMGGVGLNLPQLLSLGGVIVACAIIAWAGRWHGRGQQCIPNPSHTGTCR